MKGHDRRQLSTSTRPWHPHRRDLLRFGAASMGAGVMGGLQAGAVDASSGGQSRRPNRPLRAAFSNIGLQVTWCAQGKQAAEFWGRLFNVEVTWFDGGLSASEQRAAVEKWHPATGTSSPFRPLRLAP